jgi:hypothetical protein
MERRKRQNQKSLALGAILILVTLAITMPSALARTHRGATTLTTLSRTSVAVAHTSDLLQDCKSAELHSFPTILNEPGKYRTMMFNAGKFGQGVVLTMSYEPNPEKCQGVTQLNSLVLIELADPKNHKHLTNIGYYRFSGDNGDDHAGAVYKQNPAHNPDQRYECTPGPGKTPVWLVFRDTVKDLSDSHRLGRSQTRHRLQIQGGGC